MQFRRAPDPQTLHQFVPYVFLRRDQTLKAAICLLVIAIHIHQKPLCEGPDFKTAGGHFNPDNKQHGTLNPLGHHNGDLGLNLTVGVEHTAVQTFTIDYLSIGTGQPNDVIANGGTSFVIHDKADDMKTDPTGNAGNRIACGIITAPSAQ